VYADVDGNIGFVVAARVPIRKNGTGAVPLPGENDDFVWTGYIPFDQLPQVLNPPEGMIATANARVVGPGYKPYLTDRWYGPYRTDRIYKLMDRREPIQPLDCLKAQTDVHSLPHRLLAEQLLEAVKKHPPKDERVKALVAQIPQWNGDALATSRLVTLLEFTRRQVSRIVLQSVLGTDYTRYQWSRSQVFLDRLLRERPPHWLPKEYADYDALLVAAAEAAAQAIEEQRRADGVEDAASPQDWAWGHFTSLRILHPLARSGFLSQHLSITGLQQSGTGSSVKQTGRTIGPAMRFVADTANWDNSLMNLTVGQSGQFLSPHYRDQFLAWYRGNGLPSAFSEAAEQAARRHRLTLSPN